MGKGDLNLGVSYFGNRYLEHAKKDLAEIGVCCNYVVLPFSETDMHFHKGACEQIVKEAHKRKLAVWADPWAVAGVFGGESFSKFLIDNRRSWQFLSNGKSVPCACFNSPDFGKYMRVWIKTVADMGCQAVFWDEPHFYFDLDMEIRGIYACACWNCRNRFSAEFGECMPEKINAKVRDFRLKYLCCFLDEMMGYAKKLGMKNVLTIYAVRGVAVYDLIWERLASLKNLDIFGCDPYWRWHFARKPDKYVGEFSRKVSDTCAIYKKQPHVWIQAMRIPEGKEHEIEKAVLSAYGEGVRNIAAWSYDGGELLDGLYSPRYRMVWKAVSRAYKKLRKKHG